MSSGLISILTGAKGPNTATATACATSAHAIGDAVNIIRRGDADAMIAGGTESVVVPLAIGGFAAMRALSTRNDDPATASRPWDRDRDGFVLGEGAGILVLEEMGQAVRRGAPIYAEVAGYGMSGDSHHISAPSDDGDGPFRVMRNALKDAAMDPSEIGYINAHGTSTPHGDRIETIAVKRLLGEAARERPDLLDEVDDRAPPRRGRRLRGGRPRARDPARPHSADDQLHDPGPRVRPRLHAERGPSADDSRGPLELVRVRRDERLPGDEGRLTTRSGGGIGPSDLSSVDPAPDSLYAPVARRVR